MTTPHDELPGPDAEQWPSDTVLPASAPGRRAKPSDGSPLGKVLLVVGVALVSALALFGAVLTLGDDDDAPAAQQPTTKPTVPVLSESPTPSASPTTAPSASATPSASAAPSRTSTPTPKPSSTAPAFEVDRSVPVTVLNGTSTSGLASKAAADLRAKGWTVVSIGNWRGGGVDGTTVFVVGNRDAAATMRRDLPAADLTTRPIGLMKRDRITVVVMGDYRG